MEEVLTMGGCATSIVGLRIVLTVLNHFQLWVEVYCVIKELLLLREACCLLLHLAERYLIIELL